MASLLTNLHRSGAAERVNALQWCLVNFPATVVASACSFCYASYAGLFSWGAEAIKRAEEDARQKVAEKRKKHGRCRWATLPALCGMVLLLSVLPSFDEPSLLGSKRRILDWDTLRSEVSWTMLLVCGSSSVLSQMAEVVVGLALKAVLVVSVVLSTNMVGRLLFRAEGKRIEPTLPSVVTPALNASLITASFE
ncbi:hypothetical protein MRX96_002969 [Rhipicephalus microplus]